MLVIDRPTDLIEVCDDGVEDVIVDAYFNGIHVETSLVDEGDFIYVLLLLLLFLLAVVAPEY